MVGISPGHIILWWKDLLDLALPDWLRMAFLGQPGATRLRFVAQDREHQPNGEMATAPLSVLTDTTTTSHPQTTRIVDAMIPTDHLLYRTITAPLAARGSLDSIALLDLQRSTPFQTTDIAWTLSPARTENGQLQATQWIARRSDLERWRRNLTRHGMILRQVWIDGAQTARPLADFTAQLAPNARLWSRVNGTLLLAAVVLAIGAWILPGWQAAGALHAVQSDRTQAQSHAVALRQEVEALRRQEADRANFIDLVLHRPLLSETLREVTVALPDSTWIGTLGFHPDRVVLNGETDDLAAQLVLDLAKHAQLSNPRLNGPVAKTATGSERFEILMDLRRSGGGQ